MYIFIGAIVILVVILVLAYVLTKKDIVLKVEEDEFRFQNKGTHFKVFANGNLLADFEGAALYHGERYKISNGEKEYEIHAKSNYFGNKIYIDMYSGETLVATNRTKNTK